MFLKSLYELFLIPAFILAWCFQLTGQKTISATVGPEKTIIVKDGASIKGNPVYGRNYFKNKLPFAVKDSSVSFFLRGHPGASNVILSGSFCNWSPNALPMIRTDSGWIINVTLPFGKHEYKFIIDGFWDVDNDNLLTVTDATGHINSIYYKTNLVFTVPSFNKAKNIYLAGSFNNWREQELKMIKTRKGWELPLYLDKGTYRYKFIIEDNIQGTLVESPYLKSRINLSSSNYGFNLFLTKNIRFNEKKFTPDPKVADKVNVIEELVAKGISFSFSGDHTRALDIFKNAESIAQQYNLPALTNIWINIATLYGELFDIPAQLMYLQQAYLNAEKWEDTKARTVVLEKLGYCYMNFFVPKAVVYFAKALEEYELLELVKEAAEVSGSLGYACFITGDSSKGLYFTNRSLSLNQKIDNEIGIATNYWILGDYYARYPGSLPLAFNYLNQSLEMFERHNNLKGQAEVLSILPKIYLRAPDSILKKMHIEPMDKWQTAVAAEKKSLQIYRELRDFRQLNVLLLLSQTYERAKLYDSALIYFRNYVDFTNEVTNVEKQKQIARLEWKYDADMKEEYLTLQKQISEAMTKQQRQELELRNKELLLTKQEKDIQSLAYLKTQGDLQNVRLLTQQKEEQLKNADKEKQLQEARLKTLTQEKAIAKFRQQRQWVYSLGVFIVMGLIAVYFVYRWRIRSIRLEAALIKEHSEIQQKEAEFQNKLADISLTALRSQMNPHFIFNCLNSIKLYTIQNDTAAAASYLSRFSKLIRLVLDNSRSERITLKSELAALELYIQMEAMRFKEKLTYNIHIEEDVETDYIELPPLLLQPYVENAIWHGLMHKERGGQINIKVEMKNEDSLLEINITDDGIGRAKASELKNKNLNNHASYGMKATSDRIALINQIYKTGANVVIHDLADNEGVPAGTQVTIQIPV